MIEVTLRWREKNYPEPELYAGSAYIGYIRRHPLTADRTRQWFAFLATSPNEDEGDGIQCATEPEARTALEQAAAKALGEKP